MTRSESVLIGLQDSGLFNGAAHLLDDHLEPEFTEDVEEHDRPDIAQLSD